MSMKQYTDAIYAFHKAVRKGDDTARTIAVIKSMTDASKLSIADVHAHLEPMLGKPVLFSVGGAIALHITGTLTRVSRSNQYALRLRGGSMLSFSAMDIHELSASTITLKPVYPTTR